MSRLDPLVDALKKTDAEDVRLIVGERIFLTMRNGKRVEIGREPLQASSVQALAAEVLSPEDLAAAQRMPRLGRVEVGGETIEVQVSPQNGQLSVIVRRASGATARAAIPVAAPAAAPSLEPPQKSTTVRSTNRGGNAIDALLDDMMSRQASDLHLTTGSCPVMRIHGEMHFVRERPVLTSDAVMSLVEPLFNEKARQDFEEKHDADFAYEVPGLARFRVNAFLDRNGVGAVMRQIPIEIIPADKLGLPQAVLDLCFLTKGLVVVTGPTGSGKSTTLAGMIDYINKNRSDHIITIEDPVEFVHKNIKCLVNQREVGQHTKSFKNALRAALREDPDIVLVGEMRDLETIAIAIETAETGHLVFGTLHTTTAISTVDRVIDQFPTDQQEQIRVMLSESLKGVIAQVLCKKVGGGRVAAMEILLGSSAVSSLIREGKTFQIPSVMQTSRGAGMVTMNDSLMQLVQKKVIEPKEAWMKSVDKGGLLMMFKNAGIPAPVV
ncbi:MAG TPA: type IV pilus twitching motility protein PilT [Polyangiaceae bacterium]|nr:type IV pilus twitching motility protein PilT [Polyangiaceae bacterium]